MIYLRDYNLFYPLRINEFFYPCRSIQECTYGVEEMVIEKLGITKYGY